MDEFIIYGDLFNTCLINLGKLLQCWVDMSMVINYKKYHFMVENCLILGHVMSTRGI